MHSKTTPKHVEKLVRRLTGETMPNAESTVHQDQPIISLMVIPKKLVKAHELLHLKVKLLKVNQFNQLESVLNDRETVILILISA